MDALIGTFHIDWKSMLAQLINFGIVFFLLYRYALRPLMKVLDERNQTIDEGLKDAEKYKKLLVDTKEAYDLEISKARKDADELMSEMRSVVENKKSELLNNAQKEVDTLINEGKISLALEKEKVMKEAEKGIVDLVSKSLEKVLNTTLEGDKLKDVVNSAIDDIKNTKK
jgi:F-type H+-transporting ATPase subunit b